MTPITDMIERMLALGAAPDVIVLAVRTVEMSRTNVPDMSRVYERVRKREWRKKSSKTNAKPEANDAGHAAVVVPDMSPNVPDNRCQITSLLPSVVEQESGLPRKKEQGSEVVALAKKGTRIAQTWQPSEDDRQFARDEGMTEPQIDMLRAEFFDYWISVPGQRGLKLNWSATWRNRVRYAAGVRKARTGNGASNPTMEAFDRRIAGTSGGAEQGDFELRDITPAGVRAG